MKDIHFQILLLMLFFVKETENSLKHSDLEVVEYGLKFSVPRLEDQAVPDRH